MSKNLDNRKISSNHFDFENSKSNITSHLNEAINSSTAITIDLEKESKSKKRSKPKKTDRKKYSKFDDFEEEQFESTPHPFDPENFSQSELECFKPLVPFMFELNNFEIINREDLIGFEWDSIEYARLPIVNLEDIQAIFSQEQLPTFAFEAQFLPDIELLKQFAKRKDNNDTTADDQSEYAISGAICLKDNKSDDNLWTFEHFRKWCSLHLLIPTEETPQPHFHYHIHTFSNLEDKTLELAQWDTKAKNRLKQMLPNWVSELIDCAYPNKSVPALFSLHRTKNFDSGIPLYYLVIMVAGYCHDDIRQQIHSVNLTESPINDGNTKYINREFPMKIAKALINEKYLKKLQPRKF